MSCLIALVDGKDIWMGSEGLASTEDGQIRSRTSKKMFKNKDYIIGYVGNARGGEILKPEYFTPPKNLYELSDAIRSQCSEKGCLAISEEQMQITACNYLVIHKSKLYEILSDFQMTEILTYTAVGAGADYAFSSLYTMELLKSKLTPKEKIEIALKCAINFSTTCGGTIHIEKF